MSARSSRGPRSSVNVVGISALYHDAAACVLKGGALVAAAQEERFSRIKHDAAMPRRALRFCLEQAGLSLADVDLVAYYEEPRRKLERQLWMSMAGNASGVDVAALDPCRPEREIREVLRYDGPIAYVGHHEAHAASSYFFSGFPEAATLTLDGVGEWATSSYGRARGASLELFEQVEFPDSLGLLYSTITAYLGFEVNDGEYKVMGLAPYGSPVHAERLRRLVRSGRRGQYELDLRYFDFLRGERMYSDALVALLGRRPRGRDEPIARFHEDVARSLQVVLEDILLEKVRYLHDVVPSDYLCLAGGVALNCVANGRLLREGPFRKLFVQPAANDAGGALGAAALAHLRLAGERVPTVPLRHAFLGPGYSSDQIVCALDGTGITAADHRGDEAALLEATVERLVAGAVVGWFHGRMEFGPRALGARSILADPRRPEMRDRINALVKKREGFRPFAPAVLEERAAEHFALDCPSPFMTLTCAVRSPLALPAITHVDGSARVQTVSAREAPRFAALLSAFERRTGCPMLLNTSFNERGEPIVCDPIDAVVCFARCGLDVLVLEDFLLDRHAIPVGWPLVLDEVRRLRGQSISHKVYTLW